MIFKKDPSAVNQFVFMVVCLALYIYYLLLLLLLLLYCAVNTVMGVIFIFISSYICHLLIFLL